MSRFKMKVKEGAASFYIVAFSTLILVVIAASFTSVVLSEMARTENDELSQSAYDAALAGVEDAKVAFANYQECLTKSDSYVVLGVSCGRIKQLMRSPNCDMVAEILGRDYSEGEVVVEENSTVSGGVENNMLQAYTCTMINSVLSDYTSTLTEDDTTRVIRVRLHDVAAKNIDRVKVSWYSTKDYSSVSGSDYSFSNFAGGKVAFPALKGSKLAVPPILSVGLVQTGRNFSLNDFTRVDGGTNRATVFLVPTDNAGWASSANEDNYRGIWNGSENVVNSATMIKSNNRAVKNVPLGVYCRSRNQATADFACSAWIELPKPAGGAERSDETFTFVVSLTYGQPSTSFSLEFYCPTGSNCGRSTGDGSTASDRADLSGMQIEIDSTGRANNLYRRVLSRLESTDTFFPFPLFGLELLDDRTNESLISKPGVVTCEYNFSPTC